MQALAQPRHDAPPRDEALSERVLILVADGEAASPELLAAVRDRVSAGPARFHVVLPDPSSHAELTDSARDENALHGAAVLRRALPQLAAAAGSVVSGTVSARHDPMDALEDALRSSQIDEIIISSAHHRVSEALHVDLSGRVAHLGFPVTTVTAH